MYSFRNLLKQEPTAISAFIVAAVNQLVLMQIVEWSGEVIAGYNTLLVLGFGLFYSRPLTSSIDALKKLNGGGSPTKHTQRGSTRG